MGEVEGKVALVSGGASGMGASHAELLVAEGARVVIGDILSGPGQELAKRLGDAARFCRLDVTDPQQWNDAVALALDVYGSLDVLVNNAGIVNVGTLEDYQVEDWRRVIDVNLTGTFLGMQAAVKPMKAAGKGSIVNISSVEGLVGSGGLHGYVASKFAVRGITKSAAIELAPHNVRVNSIHPGWVHTPMAKGIPATFADVIPLGRGADPAEISHLVVFLAGDRSSYATGAEFVLDGGLTSGVPIPKL